MRREIKSLRIGVHRADGRGPMGTGYERAVLRVLTRAVPAEVEHPDILERGQRGQLLQLVELVVPERERRERLPERIHPFDRSDLVVEQREVVQLRQRVQVFDLRNLVERQVEPLQVREVRQVLDHPDAVVVQAKLRERRERREVRDAVQTAEGQRDVLGVFELHRAALRVQVLRRAVHLTEWSGAERREEG
eukprot:13097-Pelagococcus_subviridis.AAC.2